MLKKIKLLFRSPLQPSPNKEDEVDYKKLRIRIPVCTFIRCRFCKEDYIKEHVKTCPCLNPNDEG